MLDDKFQNVEKKYGDHIFDYATFSNYPGDSEVLINISELLMEYSAIFEKEEVDLSIAAAIFFIEVSTVPQGKELNAARAQSQTAMNHILAWLQSRFKILWFPKRSARTYRREIFRIYLLIVKEED